MSSVEASQENSSLHIDALLSQQGPVAVYQAHAGSKPHLFYFYTNPSESTQLWLGEALRSRQGIQQVNLPLLTPHGLLEEGGIGWSVELNPGMSLREIWDSDPHNPLRSIRLVMQAVEAVSVLHTHGGIHGDIRAQNCWVGWDADDGERLVLLSEQLGLWSHSEVWEASEMSLDIAECLSPEVAAGALPNAQSDVYALGVMLFRALHGHVPFPVENAWEMAALQATSDLVRPEITPPIHDDLWSILEACLQKSPGRRISVAELHQRLQPFVQYRKPIFVNLELTDPQSIAAPTPPVEVPEPVSLHSKMTWDAVAPRPLQELSFVEAKQVTDSMETTDANLARSSQGSQSGTHQTSLNTDQDKSPQANDENQPNQENEEKTQNAVLSSGSASAMNDGEVKEEEVTQEFTVKVNRSATATPSTSSMSDVEDLDVTVKGLPKPSVPSQSPINPIQVLVGGRSLAATTGPLKDEGTDSTSKLAQLSWLEDSSERVFEAPVEFHVTATHGAINKEHTRTKTHAKQKSRKKKSRSKTVSNTGKVSKPRTVKASPVPEHLQFVIFMTLSSVITVLLLKILQKVFA